MPAHTVTLRLDVVALTSALAELAEGLVQVVERSLCAPEILRVLEAQPDALLTLWAGDGVLSLEPSQLLLEAVAAVRAVHGQALGARVEGHGMISAGLLATPSMEAGGPDPQRDPAAGSSGEAA